MTGVDYEGDEALREAVLETLAGVVDPELSLGIDDAAARVWGDVLNIAALLVFAAIMARSFQLGFRILPRPKRRRACYVHEHHSRQRPS